MNLPNKLTIFRVLLIPVFLILLNLNSKMGVLGALVVFIIASITDQLDGYIARKYNLITDFGKFMDPLADKLLVSAAFISFVDFSIVEPILVIVIISREFIITGIRLVLATRSGEVVAANIYGKLKTVFQILAIIFLLIELYLINFVSNSSFISVIQVIADATFYLCVILTVLSGWDYVKKNIKILKESL